MSEKFKPLEPDLWAPLTPEEKERAESLKPLVDSLHEPKEFWISDDGDNGIFVSEEKSQGFDIHVIEYRAYESAKAVNERGMCIDILNRRNDGLTAALNKIGMLGKSELAYTSEFTERVTSIVNKALSQG